MSVPEGGSPGGPFAPSGFVRKPSRREFLRLVAGAGAFGLATSYPVLAEPHLIQTNSYRIPVPNLPEAFSGFRVAQLTDLHYGPFMPPSLVRSVIERTNALGADAIVCTGDYVREFGASKYIDGVWPMLGALSARSGVYAVLGNHDHWADTDRSLWWLARSGQDLRHKTVTVERDGHRLCLAGAGDLWEDYCNVDKLLAAVPESDCRVVLAHNPDTADTGFAARVDLMISGHTHGGQVRIPFVGTPILPVRNRTYTSGLKKSPRGTSVFISRGVGWSPLPVRFNCPPEIAVLELVPAITQA